MAFEFCKMETGGSHGLFIPRGARRDRIPRIYDGWPENNDRLRRSVELSKDRHYAVKLCQVTADIAFKPEFRCLVVLKQPLQRTQVGLQRSTDHFQSVNRLALQVQQVFGILFSGRKRGWDRGGGGQGAGGLGRVRMYVSHFPFHSRFCSDCVFSIANCELPPLTSC
jgi:hypothetical protein